MSLSKNKNYYRSLLGLFLILIALLALGARRGEAQTSNTPPIVLQNPFVSKPFIPVDTAGLPPAPAFTPEYPSTPLVRELKPLPNRRPSTENAFKASGTANIQDWLAPDVMPVTLTNWEGISATGVLPPDTNGQVGPNHYIQIVNHPDGSWVRIWDKSGVQLYNFSLRDLWPADDPCYIDAYGDPVVLYDQMADRWLLTQFSLPKRGPYYECIAVSKNGTPTNVPADWHLYTFKVHNRKMNDYPKLGVWPDGYYMSVNQFLFGVQWAGAGVYVFDRDKMLNGDPATFQYFDLADVNDNYGGLLPSNLMGDTPPPVGAPNYFMAVDMDWNGGTDDILHIWEFHTDWNTPANSTFSLVKELTVAPFDWNLNGIPQPNTAQKLDALSDRLMMHLWYRNYGDHESLVVNHTVDVGGDHAGVRWYEIRGGAVDTTLADATIYQQSTYAPDADHRWMGSVAMDRVGNLAVGFSVSNNATVYPSIRYAGRLNSDPLGQLAQGEATIIDGGGSQTSTSGRWGDYSSLTVDPVDDCTFWFTTEYMETTSEKNWQTRVGSFKFDNCCGGSISDVDGLSNSQSGNDVVLNWLDAAGASEYKVYRATDPYFTPDDAVNLLATVTGTSYTDQNAIGDASINYYYKVLAVDACPPSDPNYTQRVGEFDFDLMPGVN